MTRLQFLDKYIEDKLVAENEKDSLAHISSGKLSASMLGQPLQWQVLKIIGVPGDALEEYVTRKFARGNDVEDWLVNQMPGIVEKQKLVEYKNVVGYVDAIVDMKAWNLEFETLPHEIKSVSNMKYKRITKSAEPDKSHCLQACLYALALDTKQFCIDYVASDDYRVETYMLDTRDYSQEIENIISRFDNQLKIGLVPEFEAYLDWQNNEKYANYKRFKGLNSEQIDDILSKEYPEAYKKLKGLL